ncbi:hypothetical protein [Desulfobaculum bizertense]|uniref:Uncharacterized protein n=1 Tax=Desulfobaculum bizertense DSM 18034 TaxID=1121442 RepID=A0A1T4VFV2_9BACT|nr:hypothetical protein [Desulfobaculum bizertense]UIJ37756.1 hypothetical protein LWC08_13830 [Desulfobaculum bizertense]SKA63835.1 hypothetical protein SAMN02745702_00222 [Desulfobaculum bizertense DSM 18034]
MRFSLLPPESGSGGVRFLRLMLLICVFIGVGWLYTKHFDNTIEEIQARADFKDSTGQLSRQQKKDIRELAQMIEKEYGITVRIDISDKPVDIPQKLDNRTLYVGVNTATQDARFLFPPLMARALGPEYPAKLAQLMKEYFARDSWPTGILKALATLWEDLASLNTTGPQ